MVTPNQRPPRSTECLPPPGRALRVRGAGRKRPGCTGQGVHIAARVGAAAVKEEILVSAAVVSQAGPIRFNLSEPRSVALKGIREPIEVQSVDWR